MCIKINVWDFSKPPVIARAATKKPDETPSVGHWYSNGVDLFYHDTWKLKAVSAYQSSQYSDYIASRAIDGNTATNAAWNGPKSCTHTNKEFAPW
jgi:hypothetical protein